ncbi:MAG TPA: Na/Pi cotransporter family protein [Phycisphaerae bacterium]|nr:Na/Pi cotransporter family protein [Phycisphaerae bacterium]
MVFGTVGGLGLFLFGMGLLSQGLKKAAGDRLKRLLEMVTKWPLLAFGVGAGVTCLIQSSSATTVMTVGLINAGLLSLKQAICVVMGANVGTSATAWMVALMSIFKVTDYALPAVALGFLMTVVGRRERTRYTGQILLGFGILFLGIEYMKEAFTWLRADPQAGEVLTRAGTLPVWGPILAVLVGTLLTMLLQSSSATIAMVQVAAMNGAFGTNYQTALDIAIPFVLGGNIGTTITAQIAAFGSNRAGKRTAMAHTLFNVLGVAVVLPFVYLGWFTRLVEFIYANRLTGTTIAFHIAASHTLFNVASSMIFLPLVSVLERVVLRIIPVTPEERATRPVTLERHLLDTPPLAMDQARRELVRMMQAAREALGSAVTGLRRNDRRQLQRVAAKEEATDQFQTEITRYLVELSQRNLSPEMANELPVLLHSVNDIERVGDHAINIAEIAARKIDQNIVFSDAAQAEILHAWEVAAQMFASAMQAVGRNDLPAARGVLKGEAQLNQLQHEYRRSHVQRLGDGTCTAVGGLIFVDYIDNMEKIGDHLTNVAQAILGGLQWDGTDPSGETLAGMVLGQ